MAPAWPIRSVLLGWDEESGQGGAYFVALCEDDEGAAFLLDPDTINQFFPSREAAQAFAVPLARMFRVPLVYDRWTRGVEAQG